MKPETITHTYGAECRDCDHDIRTRKETQPGQPASPIYVRCRECKTLTRCFNLPKQ